MINNNKLEKRFDVNDVRYKYRYLYKLFNSSQLWCETLCAIEYDNAMQLYVLSAEFGESCNNNGAFVLYCTVL